ncbi:MAG: hypothetical protein HGA47_06050, partial [Zoogloea sp.]|nr:hypothetical protein [Zoogloea sp.]
PLRQVGCPTLFITAGGDGGQASVRQAYDLLACERDWQTVEEADEHFLAPGMLDAATRLAVDWLDRHIHAPETQAAARPE